ncbi:hypothetical protein D3C85_1534490 [compost metagenome]
MHVASFDQAIQRSGSSGVAACGHAALGCKEAEVRQPLLAHLRQIIREGLEAIAQQIHVTLGVGLCRYATKCLASSVEQLVIQLAPLGRQCRATLLDLAEAGGVAAACVTALIAEGDLFL